MKRAAGSVMILVLVFGAIFLTVLGALSGFVLAQSHVQDLTREQSEAFTVAEAGLEYYRWFLSHFPGNATDGTGHAGPYSTTYADPEGGTAGTYKLSIVGNTSCGVVQSIDVTSVGTPSDAPNVSQTLIARFAQPSVATYSYVVNSSVWAGADRVINGPYHSNGGVRMDGTTNAPVSSSLSTWDCTTSYGCSPEQTAAPGVVGSSANKSLWAYPTPQVDFAGIAADFSSLKTTASASGIYLARYSTTANPNRGYHLIFNSNGTVTIKKVSAVTALTNVQPIDASANTITDETLIGTESTYETLTLPSTCGLIFVEDNTWVEGTIPAKVTLVVANVTNQGVTPTVVLHGNITYAATNGTDGLTLIGEGDVLIAPDSPQNMTLNGTFIAQSGAFGRNYYYNVPHGGGVYGCNGTYEPRGTLTILGTTVSNLRTGTAWVNGCSAGSNAGYQTRVDAFDRQNSTNPPPFTPVTSSQWQFVNWQQQ